MSADIIGYDKVGEDKYEPIYEPQKGYVYSAAMIMCYKCGVPISGMGGPRYKAICVPCYKGLQNE